MKRKKYIWEVYHDGPCGASPLGFYLTEKSAKLHKKRHDRKHTCDWDHARIAKHEVKP